MSTNPHPGKPREEQYALFETPIGPCGIAWSERGLTRLQLPEMDHGATEHRLLDSRLRASEAPPAAIQQVIAQLQSYLAGERVDFAAVPLDLAGVSPFYRKVYEAARAVGWGQTTTYGVLARQVGVPGAARAVGQSMSKNPIAIIIPCHRVLASGNRVGGFSAFGGTFAKEHLLALEGVSLNVSKAAQQALPFGQPEATSAS
jgi:methylated-DNA-[protein]-cysteine S-methyltransferase